MEAKLKSAPAPARRRRLPSKWHWVEDDNEVVVFVGSAEKSMSYYRRHGGTDAGLHLMEARTDGGNEDIGPPVTGEKWGQ